MNLFDPHRHRVGDKPALLARRSFVVPQLIVWPHENPTRVRISAMVPVTEAGYVAKQVSAIAETDDLPRLLDEFRADPEGFLKSFFNVEITEEKPKQELNSKSSILALSSDSVEL